MVMIFENLKKVDAFANVVGWSIYQQILKRIGQALASLPLTICL
jgi:hypothetical protein